MMKRIYKTECFVSGENEVKTFYEYKDWLKRIQTKNDIEVISVTSLRPVLIVTYKEVGGNQ